jgi:large subunit ribosomal protein L20
MKVRKAKIFEFAKGYYGRRKNTFNLAIRAVHRAWQRAYIDRKRRARDYRTNWIQSTNSAARQFGLTYSQLVRYLPAAGVDLNRKALSDLCVTEPFSFRAVVEVAKQQMVAERGPESLHKGLTSAPVAKKEPEMR